MAAPRPAERPRHTLLILVAAALTLLTLQFRGVAPLDAFQQGVRDILSPVRSVVERVTDPVRTVWGGIFDYGDLRGENERLQPELARMRGESLTAEADDELLERLLGEVDIAYTDRKRSWSVFWEPHLATSPLISWRSTKGVMTDWPKANPS